MKRRIIRISLGVIGGGLLGYGYYALVGCHSGGCPLTSSPVMTTAYGALVGLAVTGL